VYYVLVVGGAVLLLWVRRGKTILYNVDPGEFERALAQLMDRLGLEWNRLGNRVFVGAGRPATVATPERDVFSTEPLVVAQAGPGGTPPRPAGDAAFDIEPFAALCHVTLHWHRHSGLVREELEAEIGRAVAEMAAPDNPAASWLMGAAGFLLALIFLGIFVIALNTFFPPRH
jgi:hypothetical protein